MATKILIVEDDNNIADLLRLYLEKENYEVCIASDGGKGVEQFRRFQPDLVLLDLIRYFWPCSSGGAVVLPLLQRFFLPLWRCFSPSYF